MRECSWHSSTPHWGSHWTARAVALTPVLVWMKTTYYPNRWQVTRKFQEAQYMEHGARWHQQLHCSEGKSPSRLKANMAGFPLIPILRQSSWGYSLCSGACAGTWAWRWTAESVYTSEWAKQRIQDSYKKAELKGAGYVPLGQASHILNGKGQVISI